MVRRRREADGSGRRSRGPFYLGRGAPQRREEHVLCTFTGRAKKKERARERASKTSGDAAEPMTLPPLLGIVEQAKCGCRTKSAHWLHRQTPGCE